jgi:hypothetical protein
VASNISLSLRYLSLCKIKQQLSSRASQESFQRAFVSNNQPAKILSPCKHPFNFQTSAIPSRATHVLGHVFSIHAVWGDQFDSAFAKLTVQFVGVIGVVAYQILGAAGMTIWTRVLVANFTS